MTTLILFFQSLIALFASDFLEQILDRLSDAILLAAEGNSAQRGTIPRILQDLAKLEIRPKCLTVFAYKWCSAIYENHKSFEGWEDLLLVCLELGFRHLDAQRPPTDIRLTHTEHHRGLVGIVFKTQNIEVIADFLHAWTTDDDLPEPAGEMVDICTGHLIGLHNLIPFPPRLRQLVIRFAKKAGRGGFEGAGVQKLVELLDHLHVAVEEMDNTYKWASLLLDVIRSPEGTQSLSHWYWELLVELAVLNYWGLNFGGTDTLKIVKSLIDAQEWDKLECWIGTVWMNSESAGITEEDLESSTLLLFRQRPGAAQKLGQWMERWRLERVIISKKSGLPEPSIPELFHQIFAGAHEVAQRQDTP